MPDHFNWLAPFYDRLIRPGEAEPYIKRIDLPVSGLLLDAGGGTGRIGKMIKNLTGGVVNCDISTGMLREAQRKELTVVYTPSEKLPFHDEAFERVLMVDALHHVADQAATARELWRVLRTGGKLLIVEPDIRQWVVKGIALFEKIALMRSHFLPPEKIVELFKEKEINSQIQIEKATAWITIKK